MIQVSIGYFLSDLAMIFYNYPALGGVEYVSSLTKFAYTPDFPRLINNLSILL